MTAQVLVEVWVGDTGIRLREKLIGEEGFRNCLL